MAETRLIRRLAAIVAADVVGYSRLMEIDESGTHVRLKTLRHDVFDPVTMRFGGRIFKNTGDGALAEFPSAVDAVQCMVEIQKQVQEHNAYLPDDRQLLLRVGISMGDVIVDGDDLYGNGVNIAARMETLAETGGICVSGNVYEHVAGTVDADFENLGEQSVKNLHRPVRAYRLRLLASGPDIDPALTSPSVGRPSLPEKPSIAVLPFQNMSGDPEQEFFADGMAEDIITSLSRYRSLFVIARNSTFAYKGQSPDLRELSRDLGVRYVLEGSVRKGGSRIRVTGQLIEGATGNHIWAERYDRELDDIFALQDEITETIVSAIGPEIDQAERDRAQRLPPENLDAWELFQRGLWHLYRFNREDNAEAQRLFSKAAEADPNFAPASSGLTHALYYSFMHGYAGDREKALDDAYEAGRTAIATDERDADAHFALGRILYLRHDLEASRAEFQSAIALNPNFAPAHMGLATALLWHGGFDACLESCDQSVRLSPKDPILWLFHTVRGMALICLDRHVEAVETLRQANRQPTAAWTAHCVLASACGHVGDFARAKLALDHTLRIKPDLNLQHLREIFPFQDPAHFDIVVTGLSKAGMDI